MIEKIYEALKTTFDADADLSGAFGSLYEGEPPDPTEKSMPWCTMVTGEDSHEDRDFGGVTMWTEQIVFRMAVETLEECNEDDGYISFLRAAFDNAEADIDVTGVTIMDIHEVGGDHVELDYGYQVDRYYMIQYYRTG